MGNGVPQPNYTQVPNVVLNLLPQMKESELKVVMVIVRETFGWHRDSAKLSLTYLQGATGLSRQGVVNGLTAAMDRGLLQRTPKGKGFLYSLLVLEPVNEVDTSEQQKTVDQSTELTITSQRSRPSLVNEVDQSEHPLKKGKKVKEKDSAAAPHPAPTAKARDLVFDAVAEGSFGIKSLTPVNGKGGRIGKIAGWLKGQGKTADLVQQFYRWYEGEHPGINAPRDLDKFQEHFTRFEQTGGGSNRASGPRVERLYDELPDVA